MESNDKYRVLSIDGGGIRGIIPAVILARIEQKKNQPIAELFDLIVGTSTGGIIAAGLAARKADGSPAHRATELIALYEKHGKEIFNKSLWHDVPIVGGALRAFNETYRHEPLERVLQEYFRDLKLSDCSPPVAVTSYDLVERITYFFKTSNVRSGESDDYHLRDVGRATSAAPTYFEPALLGNRVLVDGGVFANNPAMCAYVEAQKLNRDGKDLVLVSLGTGKATRRITHGEAKDWGILGWARPILSVMMDGTSDATHYHLDKLVPAMKGSQRYFRFDEPLEHGYDDLDDATDTNIAALKSHARSVLSRHKKEVEALLNIL